MLRAFIYLLAIITAEVVTVVSQPLLGIVFYTILLVAIIIDSALIKNYSQGKLILSLSVVPLIRIISLALPLADLPQIWWYPIIYLPLLVAVVVLMRIIDYGPRDVGISAGFLPVQLAVGLTGVGFGIIEYLILRPEPFVSELTWQLAWWPVLLMRSIA